MTEALLGGRPDWAAARRLLAVRLDNLGDVVMLGPALRALGRAAPQARLDLLASPAGAAVAPLLPDVDDVVTTRAIWQDARHELPLDPGREWELISSVRARSYDAAVVFTSFAQSPWPAAYLLYLAGVPVRVGQSREFGGSVLSHSVVPPRVESHQVDRALHLLDAVGVPPAGRELSLTVPATARDAATTALRAAGVEPATPYALLAPGASCPSRRYPPERFAAVARGLADAGLPVAVVGSQREHALVAAVVADSASPAGVVGLAGAVDVPGLAALVEGAAVAVTNNSGGMHLADALGTPVVALFAGTELEEQFRPRTTRAVLLRVPTACAPCHALRCPYGLECLDITVSKVVGTALRLAARAPAQRTLAATG